MIDFKNKKIIIQGITGREGQRALEFMQNYHTQVIAGVTPGKGGQDVNGIPVFNSIKEVNKKIDISSIYVPAFAAMAAIQEAVKNKIKFIHCLTEGIPYQDLSKIIQLCQQNKVQLLGPGSLGHLIVNQGRLGMLGGDNPDKIYFPGSISIISRSGGMINEIAHYLAKNKIGLRQVIHLGSEIISGSSLAQYLKLLYTDRKTKKIIIFDELTHNGLDELLNIKPQKPIILNLVGSSQSIMPSGVPFGHVDSLLKKDNQSLNQKINQLTKQGFILANSYEMENINLTN